MLRLELLKLPEHLIEVVVGDLWLRLDVVKTIVAFDLAPQFLDLRLCAHDTLERYLDRSTTRSAKPIARSFPSMKARNSRRPLTRLRFIATNRIPRAVWW